MITHYRIDQRLIHGQTTAFLVNQIPCDGILLIDDEIAADPFLTSVFKGVVPESIKVHIFSVEKALKKLPEAEESAKNYFVIFKHPTALADLFRKGYVPKGPVYLGPQQGRDNTRLVLDQMLMTDSEINDVSMLDENGVDIRVQPILTHQEKKWKEVWTGGVL